MLQENGGQRRRVQHVMDVCAFVCTMQARQLRTLQAKEPRRVPTSANRSTPKRVCNETRPRCTKQNGKGEKGKGRLRRRRENYILIHFIVFNSFNTRLLSSSVAETLKLREGWCAAYVPWLPGSAHLFSVVRWIHNVM